MEELLVAILANPIFRSFVEGVAIKVVVEILHRRSLDPDFLKNSDAAFAQYAAAQTDEEINRALQAIQKLINSSPAP